MSNDRDDSRNGFKNSRIDLSQLGDDTWSKPVRRHAAAPGPRRKPGATASLPAMQRTHLDELFESRVRAAAARRTVKQSRRQNRVWMFAGGLFLASVGGVAAAYYLVGPPMATTAQVMEGADYQAAQTSSLEADQNIAGTSSHFQGKPVLAAAPGTPTDDDPEVSVAAQPAADNSAASDVATRDLVAPPAAGQVLAADPVDVLDAPKQAEQQPMAVTEAPVTEEPEQPVSAQPEAERMVRIVPTAVSDEVKTKTNVNASKDADASGASDGQWLALPSAEKQPAASPVVTAAATRQSNETKPADGPVKSQQELFEAFQVYLKSTGQTATGNAEDQEALFDKFMSWSVEALKDN